MVKLLLVIAMLTINANSQECIRASYIVDQVQDEMAIQVVAAKVPSPKEIPYHPQDEQMDPAFPTLSTEPESVGHIDQQNGYRS